jgi:hypothetical protein
MKQTAINFTSEQYQQLVDESRRTGVSIAGLVRLAVNKFLKEAQ